MDIDTSSLSAARKNLVILSMGFILFTLGDAALGSKDGNTTISILSGTITFNNPHVLGWFAWIMLFWFLLRFWQFSKIKHLKNWHDYWQLMYMSKIMKHWFKQQDLDHLNRDRIARSNFFEAWEFPVQDNSKFIINKYNYAKKFLLIAYVAFTEENFGQYYFPYILCFIAIAITALKIIF